MFARKYLALIVSCTFISLEMRAMQQGHQRARSADSFMTRQSLAEMRNESRQKERELHDREIAAQADKLIADRWYRRAKQFDGDARHLHEENLLLRVELEITKKKLAQVPWQEASVEDCREWRFRSHKRSAKAVVGDQSKV